MSNVFEEKNLSKAVLMVGLPAMLGQLTTLIYNMADTFFVSLTKEPAMIAAVTLCTPILLIIMSIACIFGMGGSSVIARLLGKEEKKQAASTLNFCTYAMLIAGVIVMIIGLLFLPRIVMMIGADEVNMGYTADYLLYIFIGTPFIMLSNGLIHLFRSTGLIKEGTLGLMIGNGTNIVLDFLFINIFGWGAAGAAAATSLGFVISSLYYLLCLIKKNKNDDPLFDLAPSSFNIEINMIKDVVKMGIPGALISVLVWSW